MTRSVLLAACVVAFVQGTLGAQEDQPLAPLPPTVIEAERPEPEPEPTPPPPQEEARQPGGPFFSQEVEGYLAETSTTASRLETSVMDLPFSLQTVPQDLLQDRMIFRGNNALETVPGAFAESPGSGGSTRRANIRGFRPGSLYRDGVREQWRAVNDAQNWERVEVLKGPAAIFFGAGEIGGIVNFITKRPHGDEFTEFGQVLGSWEQSRTTLDKSGRLDGPDGNWYYRLNVAYENFDNFRTWEGKAANNEYLHLAPVLTWKIDDDTSLTFEYNYGYVHEQFDPGTVLFSNGSSPNIPRERRLDDDLQNLNGVKVSLFSTEFFTKLFGSENLFLRHKFLGVNENIDLNTVDLRALNETPGPNFGDLTRRSELRSEDVNRYYNYVDLASRIEVGDVQIDTVLGTDFVHRDGRNSQARTNDFTNFNIFNPTYNNASTAYNAPDESTSNSEEYGTYGLLQFHLPSDFTVVLGGRVSFFDEGVHPTGRAGVTYRPFQDFSVYGSYAQGFNSNDQQFVTGEFLDPETSEQWETGVKMSFLEDRLLATLAAWDITRQNLPADDPLNPGFSILLGEMQSKGVEFGLAGELTDRWSAVVACSYIDARITADENPALIGNRLNNVPYTGGSAWLKYDMPLDPCGHRTIGAGFGVFSVAFRQGNLDNTFQLPGYTRCDLGFWYRTPCWWWQLNLQNLFDKEYFEASTSTLDVFYGSPLSVSMQAGVRF